MLFSAGAGHRTGLAVAAVADHGLALLFLFDHADDDCCHDCDQHSADDNCPDIAYDPLEHTLNSLLHRHEVPDSLFYLYLFGQLICFLIRLEEHE